MARERETNTDSEIGRCSVKGVIESWKEKEIVRYTEKIGQDKIRPRWYRTRTYSLAVPDGWRSNDRES